MSVSPFRAATTAAASTDERLAVDCREGDRPACDLLFHRYLGRVYAYSLHCLGERTAAEDATQATFIKAWSSLGKFHPGSFDRWLFRIARNVVIDEQRMRIRRPTVPLEAAAEQASTYPEPEASALERQSIETVEDLMQQLSPADRELVSLRLQGFSAPDIATLLGESVNTIYQRQFRAARRLRELMTLQETAAEGKTPRGGDDA